MDSQELRALSDTELYTRLEQARKEMMNLRFQFAMGQLTDVSRIKIARRNVARILTLMRDRELHADQEGTKA
jgi:large subunit ribosomal protein L29